MNNRYQKAAPDVKEKADKIMAIIDKMPMNKAKEIVRIISAEVYLKASDLESALNFSYDRK